MSKHYSVGAIIIRSDRYLLIDRVKFPFGYACVAGHRNPDETDEEAVDREVIEETKLVVVRKKLVYTEVVPWNTCSKGINVHDWKVYECDATGDVLIDPGEAKSYGWYTREEIYNLNLEPVWKYFFEKLGILGRNF
ncbi:MAG: NUDIX domain-containing protein [Candidatus Aenigmarchaeota archaeon]|nr:NUDIX domain-containing protein [Candidatus Aenigmarchaeota archaeon]